MEGGGNQGRGNMKNKVKFLSRASRESLAEKVISEYSNNLKEMSTIVLFFLNCITVVHWWTKHPDCMDFANCEVNKGIFKMMTVLYSPLFSCCTERILAIELNVC